MIWNGAAAVAFAAALIAATPVQASCTKDTDCASGKVCQLGKCVAKTSNKSAAPAKTAVPASTAAVAAPETAPATTGAPGSTPSNPALYKPSIAILGLYSWGGFGVGGRVEWPVLPNVLKNFQWQNDLYVLGGLEYYTSSNSFGGGFGDYRWNYVRIEAGAMWDFWVTPQVALYPKLTLGYDAAWLSGWNNAWGPTPSSGGIAFEGAVGVIYKATDAIQIRGEIGNGAIKAGVGFNF